MSTKREQIFEIYRSMSDAEPMESRSKDFRGRFIKAIQERVEGLANAAPGTLGMYYAWSKFEIENGGHGERRKYHSEKRVKGQAKEQQEVDEAREKFLAPVTEPTGWAKVEAVINA